MISLAAKLQVPVNPEDGLYCPLAMQIVDELGKGAALRL
jgi:hypothetical protein